MSTEITSLRNLGPKSAGWLRDAGIRTIEDLRRVGPVAAYRIVREHQPRTSLNLLWALAAGLKDRDWRTLRPEEKARLQQDFQRETVLPQGLPTPKNT